MTVLAGDFVVARRPSRRPRLVLGSRHALLRDATTWIAAEAVATLNVGRRGRAGLWGSRWRRNRRGVRQLPFTVGPPFVKKVPHGVVNVRRRRPLPEHLSTPDLVSHEVVVAHRVDGQLLRVQDPLPLPNGKAVAALSTQSPLQAVLSAWTSQARPNALRRHNISF